MHSLIRLVIAATLCSFIAQAGAAPKSKKPKRKVAATSAAAASTAISYASNDSVMRYAEDLAQRRDLDPKWVRQTLAQAHYLPSISRLMQPPPIGTPKNWRVYRSRFIEPIRIQAGARFWQAHRDTLARAEKEYGVPAEIIVGIIGVETIYGQQMGTFRVLDALTTLAFDFPSSHPRAKERTEFFRGELEQYLSLCKRTGADPLAPLGSYAGAMGLPQFMPSSWVRWAVDFDGDGRIDLMNSEADAIGSVANYLQSHQWQSGMTTHYNVTLTSNSVDKATLLGPDILPTFTVADMLAKGALLDGNAVQHRGPLALVELQNGGNEPSYVVGTENFYALTRYNWSSYYAMAVIELGEQVKSMLR